jgi:hypothetical protein
MRKLDKTMFRFLMSGCLWFITFGVAGVAHASQDSTPVIDSRYVILGTTVYDKKTDLTWQRCSVGKRWVEKKGCTGDIQTFKFDDAQKQWEGSWRVPTKDELLTLIDQHNQKNTKQKSMINVIAFPDTNLKSLWYWSSTSGDESKAWRVYFGDNGSISSSGTFDLDTSGAVRLVRGGK